MCCICRRNCCSSLVSHEIRQPFRIHLHTSPKWISPVSLVKNTQGKFYVLDSSDQKVKYVDPQVGLVRALGFKDVPKAKSRFFPGRIAIDSNDSLYIIDKMNKRIVVLDSEEKYVKSLTVEGKKHGKLYGFNDVAVSKSGVIVAVDTIGRSVFIFNSSGTVRKRFGGPAYKKGGGSLFFPVSLSIDKFDNIYILDSHMGKILAYSKDGNLKFTVSSRGFDKGSLHDPVHVILDDKRRLYTLESGRVQILKRVNE